MRKVIPDSSVKPQCKKSYFLTKLKVLSQTKISVYNF